MKAVARAHGGVRGEVRHDVSELSTNKNLLEPSKTIWKHLKLAVTWQVELAAWCLVLPTPLVRPTHLSFARARLFRTMAHALASFASLRVVAPSVGTAPRSNPGNHKRGLVIVAGKKGAWAKEFDPEYEKANAVVVAEVDVNKWPGLDSTSKERVF